MQVSVLLGSAYASMIATILMMHSSGLKNPDRVCVWACLGIGLNILLTVILRVVFIMSVVCVETNSLKPSLLKSMATVYVEY